VFVGMYVTGKGRRLRPNNLAHRFL